jgi:predicted TIM-barrel fold metal-dependent hydrolase
MQGKIALEEHFAIPETLSDSRGYFPDRVWEEIKSRVLDVQDRRLREMDEQGIALMLLSLNAPAVQAIPDKARAAEIARKAND